MQYPLKIAVIGGGAAGFFAALAAKQTDPNSSVTIFEKNSALLSKVRISGGGRCNVTHACFDPKLLVNHYPRGNKELLGPFYKFQPRNTIEWFESRGVVLKTEPDGRMFPVSDQSETIISCLISEAKRLNISILTKKKIESIDKKGDQFSLSIKNESSFIVDRIIIASGSSPQGYHWAQSLGHSIQPPVPSLFTFNIPNFPLQSLSGVSFTNISVHIAKTSFAQTGPLLITHFGLSGPAVLKLSAWAARILHEKNYEFDIFVNWLPNLSIEEMTQQLYALKKKFPQKLLQAINPFNLPKNFWKMQLQLLNNIESKRLNDISLKQLNLLATKLNSDSFTVKGKTIHKEEFVTCGGVTLKEVDFKTMESKVCPSLFFAGEVLDIDGITGGFNFQNAWTTGFIAGSSAANQ